jgi:hypothetical protein
MCLLAEVDLHAGVDSRGSVQKTSEPHRGLDYLLRGIAEKVETFDFTAHEHTLAVYIMPSVSKLVAVYMMYIALSGLHLLPSWVPQ